jgi:hypothetical protein
VTQSGSEALERDASGAVGGRRREDVPSVERPAERPEPVSPGGEHDGTRSREIEAESEEPVVGPDEVVTAGVDGDRPARAAHPGIHDREMHGAGGKEPPRRLEEQRRPPDVLRRHCMAQVDELGSGVDREENALQRADVGVIEAEVGQQGDDAVWAA